MPSIRFNPRWIRARNSSRPSGRTLTLQELFKLLGGLKQAVSRERVRAVASLLARVQLGMEPDVLGGAKAPGEADKLCCSFNRHPTVQWSVERNTKRLS